MLLLWLYLVKIIKDALALECHFKNSNHAINKNFILSHTSIKSAADLPKFNTSQSGHRLGEYYKFHSNFRYMREIVSSQLNLAIGMQLQLKLSPFFKCEVNSEKCLFSIDWHSGARSRLRKKF